MQLAGIQYMFFHFKGMQERVVVMCVCLLVVEMCLSSVAAARLPLCKGLKKVPVMCEFRLSQQTC